MIAPESLPDALEVTAKTWEDEIMGVRHTRSASLEGVQFHPESIMTTAGKQLLANFLRMARRDDAPRSCAAIGSARSRGQDLTRAEMAEVIGQIMDGEATPAQIGGFLIALRTKGETVDELVGAARAMRAARAAAGAARDPRAASTPAAPAATAPAPSTSRRSRRS